MKFGVREIVDVVFKAADNMRIGTKTFKKYQPVFMIDTATTSSLEQSTTTAYAQGGRGNARLIAWEGEKTMTFTVTDALMSPMGLAVLTGAGLIKPTVGGGNQKHVHATINKTTNASGVATITLADLNEEYGLEATKFAVCATIPSFATQLDGSGAGIEWYDAKITAGANVDYVYVTEETPATFTVGTLDDQGVITAVTGPITVQLDFYVVMNNAMTEVQITPESFGGYFYVEAQTLFRREDTGKDMAAEIIIPKAKIQSAFTFTMAASGDPSTFDFVMDAMPGYTMFDRTKKQMCVIDIIGEDKTGQEDVSHTHEAELVDASPDFKKPGPQEDPMNISGDKIATAPDDVNKVESQENQDKLTVAKNGDELIVTVDGGVDSLNTFASTNPSQGSGKWIGLDINTGESDITKVTFNGYELTDADVADADSLGLPHGHFVLWLKAENVAENPRTITLGTEGKKDTSITITVQ